MVLAVGNRLIYADTYDEALAQLASASPQPIPQTATPGSTATAAAAAAPAAPAADARLSRIREHLRRYNELAGQGKWSEAGKELEAIEAEVKQ